MPPRRRRRRSGKKGTKVGMEKPVGTGLEGFVDWVNPTLPTRETQGDCPAPHIGFSTRMRKQAMSAQGETTLDSEVPSGKCPKWSGLNEVVHKSSTEITSNSLELASDALLA